MSAAPNLQEDGLLTGPDPSTMALVDYALLGLTHGFAVHPAKDDGSKMPKAVPVIDRDGRPVMDETTGRQCWGWKHKQELFPSENETRRLFGMRGVTGLGIFTGVVSGGPLQPLPDGFEGPPAPCSLTMWEWEDRERFEDTRELAHEHSPLMGALFDRIIGGYLSATPGGGHHTLTRSPVIRGNTKLAERPATADELVVKPHDTTKVLIETREQGGWTVEPPSGGPVHPSGKPYTLVQGGLSTVAEITAEEYRLFDGLLRSFNEVVHPEPPAPAPDPFSSDIGFQPATNGYDGPSALDVIAEYNRRTTWEPLLRGAVWRHVRQVGPVGFWLRPGDSDSKWSATTNYGGSDRLSVFSTATKYTPVGNGRKAALDRFAFYCAEYHGGDNKAAIIAASDWLGMRGKSTRAAGPKVDDENGQGYFSPSDPAGTVDDSNEATETTQDAPQPDEIAAAVDRLSDLESRIKADPGVPFQPETLGALALLQERAPAEWARQKETLRKAGVSFRDLDKALKQLRAQRAGFRVVNNNTDGEPAVRLAAAMVPDAPAPRLIIPEPYFLRADATGTVKQVVSELTGEVSRVENVIAHAPLLIVGRLRDADEGTEALRLSWRRSSGWHGKTVERGTALNAQKLVILADDGAPVTSSNAKDLIPYLDALEATNHATLPSARISSHLGWQGEHGAAGFLVGRNLILPSGELREGLNLAEMPPEDWREDYISFRGAGAGDEQIADAFQARGTLDGWKRAVSVLAGHRRALLPFYGSFAAPLLEILRGANFIVDISNRTSTGKTSVLRAAASVWGNPDERSPDSVIGSWDATRVWVERSSAVLHGLPLLLDDTKRAKDGRIVADTLYAVANGRGRGRGNPRGLARTRAWRTVLISTGEAPATAFTQDGGTRTRVLSLRGAPFGPATDETRRLVDVLNLGVLTHHGQAGPAFVRWLMAHRDEWPQLGEMYQLLVERYANEARNAEAGRLAQYAATIDVTARLVHEAIDLPWDFNDPLAEFWAELAAESEDAAGDLRALRDVMSWAYAHAPTFVGREVTNNDGAPRVPITGWSGRWDSSPAWEYIGFLPTVLDRVLKDLGYEPSAITAGWADRGWLQAGDGRHRTRRVRLDGELVRVYAISREAVNEADA